jgi:hypothetical protein
MENEATVSHADHLSCDTHEWVYPGVCFCQESDTLIIAPWLLRKDSGEMFGKDSWDIAKNVTNCYLKCEDPAKVKGVLVLAHNVTTSRLEGRSK